MLNKFLIAWMLLLSVFIANAIEVDKSLEEIKRNNFQSVGQAEFSVLFWDIYQSELFTPSGIYQPITNDDPLLFQINYLRDITQKDLIEKTVEQWQHIGIEKVVYQNYVEQLQLLWPDITAGDQLALLVEPTQSHFYFNSQYLGTIDDSQFGQIFLDIWLSEKTSQPDLRQSLIGAQSE